MLLMVNQPWMCFPSHCFWLCFAWKYQCPGCTSIYTIRKVYVGYQLYNRFFLSVRRHQSSGQLTPTVARNVFYIAHLSPKLIWLRLCCLKQAQHYRHMQWSKQTEIMGVSDVPCLTHFKAASCTIMDDAC